jgi:hypothetical protein
VERSRLSVALQWLLASLAKDAPVLLVVEDLHWADEASLALLHFLTREIGQARMLIVGTYRSDDLHQRHPLTRLLATLRRERCVVETALQRLTREQIGGLMRETLALAEPGVSITSDFRDAIFARSDGIVHVPPNRFFAVARNEEGCQGRKHCARAPEAAAKNGPTAEARNDRCIGGPKRPHGNGVAATNRWPPMGGRGPSSSSYAISMGRAPAARRCHRRGLRSGGKASSSSTTVPTARKPCRPVLAAYELEVAVAHRRVLREAFI